jgi:two-component system chemotaxis response regulator CheY
MHGKTAMLADMSNQATGLEKLRVLVVDDHEVMHKILLTILNGLGIGRIVSVANPDEALKEMRRAPPDIVFLDWMLGGQDGLRFVRFIRRLPDAMNPYVPIIMMTGHGDIDHVMRARDAGVTEFLVKPISPLAVAQRLETVIHHPRPFIRAQNYVGPDRRRRALSISGPDRRRAAETTPEPQPQQETAAGESDDD